MKLLLVSYNPSTQELQFRIDKSVPDDENRILALRKVLRNSLAESAEMNLQHNKVTGLYTISDCNLLTFLLNEKGHFLEGGISEQNWQEFNAQIKQAGIVIKHSELKLTSLPTDAKHRQSEFLTTNELAGLSSVSRLFNQEIQSIDNWKVKLIEAGCEQKLLQATINTNAITNYKNLYHAFTLIEVADRKKIVNVWELLCLSGDTTALQYALEKNLMDEKSQNWRGDTPLLLAALSGNPAAIKKASEIPGGNPHAQNNQKQNAVLMAALSGNPAGLTAACEIPGINLYLTDYQGRNMMLLSALSGSIAAMEQAYKILPDITATDDYDNTLLHLAALSGKATAIKWALKFQEIDSIARNQRGENVLLLAAFSGSVAAIKEAAKIFGINLRSKDDRDRNVLLCAALSGNPAAIEAALQIPGIDIHARDDKGNNLLLLTVRTGNIAAIEFVCNIPGIDLAIKNIKGVNALMCAVLSENPNAVIFIRKLYLSRGVDPNMADNRGDNALDYTKSVANEAALREALLTPIQPLTPDKEKTVHIKLPPP